jgi:methionine-gamma-lyase
MDSRHPETLVIHGGHLPDREFGSISTPIYQTSIFAFDTVAQGAARFAGEEPGYVYSRLGNPTVRELERRMAILEGTDAALATASGMAAISAALLHHLKAGDHLVTTAALYGCTYALINTHLRNLGIAITMVAEPSEEAIEAALRPETRVIYIETPINPGLEVLDLERIARVARLRGIVTIVDNTFMTPLLQRPARHGIDVVVHSATKYLNGHGDVVAGVICADAQTIEDLRLSTLKNIGSILAPNAAWLVLRGMKTLALRMDRHLENARHVAEYLAAHPLVESLAWPGLPSHPGHRLIGRQMKAGGAVMAFELACSLAQASEFMDALELCQRSVSLGNVETLIQHPASMTHATYEPEARRAAGISDMLIRLAVGLEHAEDIVADLGQALERIHPAGPMRATAGG